MRSVLRTLLASVVIVAAGVATLAAATDGFHAFTAETARRIEVRRHPRVIPAVPLQAADGRELTFTDLRGRWLLVDFIYTRCTTYCSIQGSEFARLQDRLAREIAAGRIVLVSVSFDPARDDPAALDAYQRRSGDRGTGWVAARPVHGADLPGLMRVFGVTAIPDGLGGYVHNAAIQIVDPEGRLVDIVDWDAPAVAEQYVLQRLRP